MLGGHQLVRAAPLAVSLLWFGTSACSGSAVCEGEAAAPLAVADADGELRCEEGRFLHSDFLGSPEGGFPPEQKGSLRCYETCRSDADCNDPCLPHCSVQGLFSGGDYSCNATIRLCRTQADDDCSIERPR